MAKAESAAASPTPVQPDHDDTIQNFLLWVRSSATCRIGCGGPNNDFDRKYISWKTLKAKLSRECIDQLLEALFKGGDKPKPDGEYIRKHYLRPFAILLCIGEGRMIYHFQKQPGLENHLLPFRSKPHGFPVSSTRDDFYSAFYREQWAFCPTELKYLIGSDLGEDDILPINKKEQIDEGGSARTYKVTVDEDYDQLVPQSASHEHLDSEDPHEHIYVIKTYRGRRAQGYYETERDAFLQLKWNGKPPMNIIGFYGSFVREETYNIILEYADLGNLEVFMKTTPPPLTADERLLFWDRFLDVTDGLVRIHGESESNANIPMLLGWHQDLHPANILVQRRKGAKSIYDCHFKIADLGLSHFKKHLHRDTTDVDTFGTSAYGAPETRRPDANIEQCKIKVKQDVDIWSLGCIFSEVATWVDQGWNKIQEYRSHRSDEVEKETGLREDCFHNCLDHVLDSVREIHSEILQGRRANDYVTHAVVRELVKEMLLVTHERPDVRYLYHKSRRIIAEAYKQRDNMSNGALVNPRKPPLKMPPNLPPGYRSKSFQSSPVQLQPTESSPRILTSLSSAQQEDRDVLRYSGSSHASNVMSRDRRASSRNESSNEGSPYLPPEQWGAHISSPEPEQGTIYGLPPEHLTKPNDSSPYSKNKSQPISPYETGLENLYRLPPEHLVKGNGSIPYFKNKSQPTSPHEIVPVNDLKYDNNVSEWTETYRRKASPRFTSQDSNYLVANTGGEEYFQTPTSKRTSASTGSKIIATTANGKFVEDENLVGPAVTRQNASSKGGKRLPTMSVQEGLDLKAKREFAKYVQFPHQELFGSLKKRDHVFFIDNAESMAAHRLQVRRVLELLSYMVAPADPDGLDLYFSTEDARLKPRAHYQMVEYLDERPTHGIPDIRHRFANVLESYQNQFGRTNWFHKMRDLPKKGPRKLSLYVLTDAIWQPNTDLETEIRTLVHNLTEHQLTNKQIGIQFIRFGQDSEGARRLKKLDSGLNLDLDVVDTTRADGNVWKMLLGAINDWFDGDDDWDEVDATRNE